jgi:hypothetical protein
MKRREFIILLAARRLGPLLPARSSLIVCGASAY